MSRIVFCEIAWMKYYKGLYDDQPKNGGQYIDENGDGGEIWNFLPTSHNCYGYVMHHGNELHIEHFGEKYRRKDQIDDITVVWVASDGKNCKIVGWYEHATMYRYWQMLRGHWDYNFVANEKDCYLIEESDRSFIIPRASQFGNGRGMGQSQIWYADDPNTQIEFIPKVLEYLDLMRGKCEPIYYDPQELEKCAEDNGKSVDELLDMIWNVIGDNDTYQLGCKKYEKVMLENLQLVNLALTKENTVTVRFTRGYILDNMNLEEDAEDELKKALTIEKNIVVLEKLMDIEIKLGHTFIAIELGEELRSYKDVYDEWGETSRNLVALYLDENEIELAKQLFEECKNDTNEKHVYDWFDLAQKDFDAIEEEQNF